MYKKLFKIMGSLILALTMLFSLNTAAMADAGVPDLTKTGSVSVSPRRTDGDGSVVKGMAFTMYYVAHITTDAENNLVYELDGDFSGCKVNLGNLSVSGLSQTLADYVSQKNLTGTKGTADENGTVRFENLKPGLYLLIQNDTGTGYEVSPFLVTVPKKEGDNWSYDVDGTPKAEAAKIPTGTPVPSPSAAPAVSPSATPSPDASVTPSPNASVTPSPNASVTPSPNGSATPTPAPGSSGDSSPTPTPAEKLVQTGQLNWPVPVLAICGIVLFGIGWALKNMDKREK